MKNELAAPTVHSPCSQRFDAMHDTGQRSAFCDRCQLHVHNLSAMSKRKAGQFLEISKTRRTCLTYILRRDGTMATRTWRDAWRWRRLRARRVVLAALRVGIAMRYLRRSF